MRKNDFALCTVSELDNMQGRTHRGRGKDFPFTLMIQINCSLINRKIKKITLPTMLK